MNVYTEWIEFIDLAMSVDSIDGKNDNTKRKKKKRDNKERQKFWRINSKWVRGIPHQLDQWLCLTIPDPIQDFCL